MVAVRKPGKIRLCIDPKDLNKAIKRPHYPLPTIEDILPKLKNARMFSVLGAQKEFWLGFFGSWCVHGAQKKFLVRKKNFGKSSLTNHLHF